MITDESPLWRFTSCVLAIVTVLAIFGSCVVGFAAVTMYLLGITWQVAVWIIFVLSLATIVICLKNDLFRI